MRSLAALAVVAVSLTACTAESAPEDHAQESSPVVSTAAAAGSAAQVGLKLGSATETAETCWDDEVPTDLAWYEITWQAHQDLKSMRFELDTSGPVEQVGQPTTVPPINFGGRIDSSGEVPWKDHRSWIERDRTLAGAALAPAGESSPLAGETGILVFHVRIDPEPTRAETATITGVHATWEAADGTRGEARLELDVTYQLEPCRAGVGE